MVDNSLKKEFVNSSPKVCKYGNQMQRVCEEKNL